MPCGVEHPDGWEHEPVTVGMSAAVTARLRRPGHADRFLKVQAPTWDRGLDAEAERLAWLGTTPLAARVPEVVSLERGDRDRLVTTALSGADAAWWAERRRGDVSLAGRMGAVLRRVHDTLDVDACPFDARLDRRLDALARRVREGVVDAAEFEQEYRSLSPAQVLDRLVRERPAAEDLVVTHGDWCFPNVLFERAGHEWSWTGMVDVSGLGVACRWYDLGIGMRSVWHNLGRDPAAADAFFAGYGIEPDERLARYYILVDELQ